MSSISVVDSILDSCIKGNNDTPAPLLEGQMVTRSQKGIAKPDPKYALMSNRSSVNDPKKFTEAFNNSMWLEAMHEELRALDQNNTWVLVARTPYMNVIGSK